MVFAIGVIASVRCRVIHAFDCNCIDVSEDL